MRRWTPNWPRSRRQFEGQALVQLKGLSQIAFDALVERVTDLVREP